MRYGLRYCFGSWSLKYYLILLDIKQYSYLDYLEIQDDSALEQKEAIGKLKAEVSEWQQKYLTVHLENIELYRELGKFHNKHILLL